MTLIVFPQLWMWLLFHILNTQHYYFHYFQQVTISVWTSIYDSFPYCVPQVPVSIQILNRFFFFWNKNPTAKNNLENFEENSFPLEILRTCNVLMCILNIENENVNEIFLKILNYGIPIICITQITSIS